MSRPRLNPSLALRPRRPALACLLTAALLAAGCSTEQDELQAWMEQQKREVKPSVPPLAAPKPFMPVPYTGAQQVDPYSTQKLSQAVRQEARRASGLLAAEMRRRKEPLEAYPLDAMAMVGSVAKTKQPTALLRVDNLLYQVRLGDHLGQNYGRVTRISETEVTLREVVPDGAGDWAERITTLQLQEPAR